VGTSDIDAIARRGPSAVALGGALITLVRPTPGHERDYNRWYEDDHFYAGGAMGPYCFAARRFVAPHRLRERSLPAGGTETGGSYLAVYAVLDGHTADYRRWAWTVMLDDLVPAQRNFLHREHIYTAFHDLAFEHVYDPPPMRSFHALNHPYPGLALEVVARDPGADPVSWIGDVRDALVPLHINDPAVGQVAGFVPMPPAPGQPPMDGLAGPDSMALLWHLGIDPMETDVEAWPGRFAEHADALSAAGAGELRLLEPFVPTIVGTDRHDDQL
jgi:hypothetical protein